MCVGSDHAMVQRVARSLGELGGTAELAVKNLGIESRGGETAGSGSWGGA